MYTTREERKSLYQKGTYEYYGASNPYKGEFSVYKLSRAGSVYSWRGTKPKRDEFGWRKPNNFSVSRFEATYGNSIIDFGYDYGRYRERGPVLGRFFTLPEVYVSSQNQSNKALDQAIRDAYADLRQPDAPGFTWIAEGLESLMWFRELASQFTDITQKYQVTKRAIESSKTNAVKKVKKSAEAWLAYRYAIMPLVLQIEDVIALIAKNHNAIQSYSGYVKVQLSQTKETFKYKHLSINLLIEREILTTIKGGCVLYPSMRFDPNQYGFGLYDALLAGWELLTLSFVIDWFLGIGPWLASLRPMDFKLAYQSNTKVVERVETLRLLGAEYAPGYDHLRSKTISTATASETVSRSVSCIRDTVVHQPVIPLWNVKSLSWVRQLDAVALFIGLCGRRLSGRH